MLKKIIKYNAVRGGKKKKGYYYIEQKGMSFY